MKRKLLALAAAALFATSSPLMAGDTLFGGLGDAAMKARNAMRSAIPTDVKALEADGGNFRYYEWVAPHNPNVICWVAAGTQKGAGGCYPRAEGQRLSHEK